MEEWKCVSRRPLDLDEANAKLNEDATTCSVGGGDTRELRTDTVRVASVTPVEDDLSYGRIDVGREKQWGFWGVYDGHSGWATATVLRISLANYVARKLKELRESACGNDPKAIEEAMTSAFTQLDDEILSDALAALRGPVPHAEAMCRIAPASSGSCATFAVYDPSSSRVHVANAGDTRAVLVRRREPGALNEGGVVQDDNGVIEDNKDVVEENKGVVEDTNRVVDGAKGVAEISNAATETDNAAVNDDGGAETSREDGDDRWRAIPLSVDHVGLDESEKERVNAEHPGEDLLFNKSGRLLGSAVTRSFGDNRWKWSAADLEDWKNCFFGRFSSPRIKTPPYITATPTVQSEKVCAGDFLVIASDGFWNHMSSQDAAYCVGLWADAQQNRLSDGGDGGLAKPEAEEAGGGYPYNWTVDRADFVVEDENAATHLLRNVFGGRKRELFRSVLSTKAPDAKEARDDITVIVVHF